MATKRIVGLQTLDYQELGEGDYVVIDNAKNGNKKVDLGSLVNNLNNSIDEIEQGTAIADGAIETAKLANGAITNDKVATDAIETDNILDAAITTDKLGSDAVTNAKLADNAVQTENLVTGAVTTDKLGADSVTNAKLADNAVQTENLVNESVTNAKLASDAVKTGNIVDENVTTAKLANGAVTTAKIGADAVTNAKLADNAVQTENIVDANVTTGKIANAAVTNDKLASNAVDSANIKSSAVITAKIADGAVTHDKVATDAIEAANIKDGEVGTSELASGAVTNDKLATDSVKTGNITDANVTTAKLATGAVTNTKLASSAVETGNIKDAAVTTDKIAAGAVTNPKLATDAVQTGNIKDGNVTNAKLASNAVGTSNIQNGSVTLAKIATGSEATQSASGLMSATDKTKLDGFSQASDYALKSDVSSAINYRGSVATEADLPSTGQKVGDMYNIVAASSYGAAGTNVAWTGSAWDSLGEKFTIGNGTLTPVMVSSGYNFMTDAEQTKLSGIETGANKTIVDNALSGSSTNPVQNSVVKGALDTKAPLASPALTGTPTAPTAASGTNTTQIATTAFVKSAVDAKFPVVNSDVDTNAIATGNIQNSAVTTDKIYDGAVTHAKVASNAVETGNIKDGSVTTDKMASGAVTNDKIATDAVQTGNIKDANVTTAKLANGAVTNAKLASDAVQTANIVDGNVTHAKLASNAVETGNIKNLNVTTDKLADSAVTEAKIANGAITKAKFSSELSTELDNKANINGDYPALTVGKADNLTGRYDAVEADYLYRTAGGNQDIDTGTARIESIRGNTLVWNQYTNYNTVAGIFATVVNNDGVFTVTSTSQDRIYFGLRISDTTLSLSHIYLVRAKIDRSGITSDSFRGIYVSTGGMGNITNIDGSVQSSDGRLAYMFQTASSGNTDRVFINAVFATSIDSSGQYFIIQNINLFDLTLMFGAGNEPSTVAEFEALFPKPYYPYDAGSLLSVNMEGVRTVGFNQWDEEWELGDINGTTGENGNSTTTWRSKNYIRILPGQTYYVTGTALSSNPSIRPRFYDYAKGYIGNTDANGNGAGVNATFVAPSNACYMRFSPFIENISDKHICINLHWTGYRDGEYEPYAKYERDIPVSTYFPDGMKSVGDVYDELTEDMAIQRVGVVDLGTLSWSKSEPNVNIYISDNITDIVSASSSVDTSDTSVLCQKYNYIGVCYESDLQDGDILRSPNHKYVRIRDEHYTDPTAFKAAMSGVYLYYELAEPVETPIDPPIPLTYEVDDFGTEEIMVDETQPAPQSAPPSMQVIYGPNVIDTVRRLPKEYISHDTMTQFRNALPFETTEKWDPVHNRYKYTADNFISRLNGVVDYIRYGVHNLGDSTWDYVAGLADYGDAVLDLLPIGTELTDKWNDTHTATAVNYDMPWLVQAVQKFSYENHDNPEYGIVLGSKYTLPFGTQFDAKEAFYAAPSGGVSAAVYYVTWGATWGSKITSGNSFSFTVTGAHPEGAQFEFSGDPYSNDIDTMKVYIYDICGSTVKSEECQISAGIAEGATLLCTLGTSQIASGDDRNHLHRCVYANNRWDQSAIRQYLNTDADGGTWWTPQNKWDRPPSYASYDGFMKGLPAEFKAVIQKTKVVTALSYSADAGTADAPEVVVTYDYFFLPSWEQHWLKIETYMGAKVGLEGTPFPYWQKVSGVTTPWAYGTTHVEYIHYDLANHNTARYVFLRSSLRTYGNYVSSVTSSGNCGGTYALSGDYVVPVCVIRKALA